MSSPTVSNKNLALGCLGALAILATVVAISSVVAEWPLLPYFLGALLALAIVSLVRDRPPELRALVFSNAAVVVSGLVIVFVGSAFGLERAANRAAEQRAANEQAQAQHLDRKRAAEAEEAKKQKLRSYAPAIASRIQRAIADLNLAIGEKRWADVPPISAAIFGDVTPYSQLTGLPVAMTTAMADAKRARAAVEPILIARLQLEEGEKQLALGKASQARGDFVGARAAFETAHATLSSITEEQVRYAPDRARLIAGALAAERLIRSKASRQQKQLERQDARARRASEPSDLERILQAKCGRTTDANGEWIAAGAEARAFCRRDVELALERRGR